MRPTRAEPHTDEFGRAVPAGDVIEAGQLEVGTEGGVDHLQGVHLEFGRNAGGVIVRRDQAGRILDQVDPEQESFTWPQALRHGGQEAGSFLDREVANGAPEEGDQPVPDIGEAVQVHAEVADHPGHLDGGVRLRQGAHRRAQGGLGHIERHEAAESAGITEGVEQGNRLVRRA